MREVSSESDISGLGPGFFLEGTSSSFSEEVLGHPLA
jgi:hypothetical protein